jgi:hypothetical protein
VNDHRLPTTARNEVFRRVRQAGLDPSDFEWSEEEDVQEDARTSVIRHRPTGYFFHFFATHALGDLYIGGEWSPPFDDGSVRQQVNYRDEQLDLCDDWLRVVKREYDAEDLWAALRREANVIVGEVVDEGNARFTDADQRALREGLDEIRAYITRSTDPSPAQEAQINVTFQYVAEASERLTKRDWKNIFVSSVIGLLITLGTNPDVIHGTLALATKYIVPLLGMLRLPPGL